MKTIIPVVIMFSVILLIPLGYQSAMATSAGLGDNPNAPHVGPVFIPGSGGYDFEHDADYDPNGGPLEKHFDQPLVTNIVQETIRNTGTIPITDWHEEFPDQDGTWVPGIVVQFSSDCGNQVPFADDLARVSISLNPGPVPPANSVVWFDFDPPIAQNECFFIDKLFNAPTTPSFIRVLEYPTADLDFGDLLDAPHPTLLASDGARHVITGAGMSTVPDAEPDGQPSVGAVDDDSIGVDDEDGIFPLVGLEAGTMESLTVFNNMAGDINIFMAQGGGLALVGSASPALPGPTPVTIDLTSFGAGTADMRVRFCTTGDCGTPMSGSLSGEVEDYVITLIVDDPPPPNPVGGTGIPISTTSLILAGLDSNYSILMALAVIGFGAFGALYYSTKKKSEETLD